MGPARVHETGKGSQGAVVKRRWDGRQGSIARASKGCVGTAGKGVYTRSLYFFRSRGSDSTGNGVFSLLRGMCSPWFSYFKAFRGIAERGVKFFFGQFFAVLTSLIVKTSFLESSPLPLNDSSLSVSV